jgi:hypothetical protein
MALKQSNRVRMAGGEDEYGEIVLGGNYLAEDTRRDEAK